MRSAWSPFGWQMSRKKEGGAFSPLQLTNLRAWYKSDVGITTTTGVSQWDDQSGNGNHLVQAVGASQPVVTAAAINGLPAITFDGVDDMMRVVFALVQPETVFIVLRQDAWTVSHYVLDGSTSDQTMAIIQRSVSPIVALSSPTIVALNSDLTLSTFGLLTALFNDASSDLQVNNLAATTGGAGTNGGGGLRIGNRGGGGAGTFTAISVAEIIVMAAAATAGERANVRAYSQARYGVGA